MTSEGSGSPRSPGDGSTDDSSTRPAAAADLLQMWIGGGSATTSPTTSPTADEPADDVDVDVEAVDEPAADPAAEEQPDVPAQSLWPESDDAPGAEAAEEWWPYDEQAAAAQQPAEVPEAVTEPDPQPAEATPEATPEPAAEALWDDSVETEWSEPDPAHQPDAAAEEVDQPDAAQVEEPHERGWASFGAAQTAEDVLDQLGREDGWAETPPAAPVSEESLSDEPVAAPTDESADEVVEEPVVEPTPLRPRQGLDLSATTHWSLDDFESYIRAQGSNELAGWMSGSAAEPEPEPDPQPEPAADPETAGATEPEPEPEPEPAAVVVEQTQPEPPGEQTIAWTPIESAAQAPAEPPAEPALEQPADAEARDEPEEPAAQPRMRGLLAKMGLAREQEPEAEPDEAVTETTQTSEPDTDSWAEADVAWESPATDGPATQQPLFEVPEPEPTAASGAIDEPGATSPASGSSDWDPDATQYFDWTLQDVDDPAETPAPVAGPEDVPLPTSGPVGSESILPGAHEVAPEPEPAPEPAVAQASSPDEDDQDYQEWYDDQGLRWVSTDGGYTWFSDDGQGWNAEVGEPIEVAAGSAPSAAPAAAPAPSGDAPTVATDVGTAAAPGWTAPAPAEPAEDVWPTSEAEAPDDAATTTPAFWPEPDAAESAAPATDSATAEADPYAGLYAGSAPVAAATPAAPPPGTTQVPQASGPSSPGRASGGEEIPPFVEYKPRGAYRPVLGVLFVAAAILAVVAIFWAVSKGSQAATGIAAGVTGFALAFWWGLLSWTPTVVSLSGSVLEVARGSDGERFDLRSPKLVIDVDEDVDSRNWRTTITRPNGTELVIPASAVDPEEFSRIVRHYRAEVGSAPGSPG